MTEWPLGQPPRMQHLNPFPFGYPSGRLRGSGRAPGFSSAFDTNHWSYLLWALLLAGAVGGMSCSRAGKSHPSAQSSPTPQPIVLDYRNGWQHLATGEQPVALIADFYDKEPELVARLNSLAVNDIPKAGRRLYIPPTNDRRRLREVLARIQGRPELVPDRPWRHKQAAPGAKRVIASKSADDGMKVKVAEAPDFDLSRSHSATKDSPSDAKRGQTRTAAVKKSTEPKRKRSGLFKKSSDRKRSSRSRRGAGPDFLWPVQGKVVTKFRDGWKNACHGIEITTRDGESVRAARAGRVLLAQEFISYGNLVVIDHGDGYATAYGYNRDVWVKEGDYVKDGQQIARVGSPYKTGDPMLFFQIRRNAKPVDPLKYLN